MNVQGRVQGVCDDFVESFKDKTEFSGVFWKFLIDFGLTPEGLDREEPGVKEIIERARTWRATHG